MTTADQLETVRQELAQLRKYHDEHVFVFHRRLNELLEHNNALLERARAAERERDDARAGLLAAATFTQKIIAAFRPRENLDDRKT